VKHFSEIGEHDEHDPDFDLEFHNHVRDTVAAAQREQYNNTIDYHSSMDSDITMNEVTAALRTFANGRAAGPDGLVLEFINTGARLCCVQC